MQLVTNVQLVLSKAAFLSNIWNGSRFRIRVLLAIIVLQWHYPNSRSLLVV